MPTQYTETMNLAKIKLFPAASNTLDMDSVHFIAIAMVLLSTAPLLKAVA